MDDLEKLPIQEPSREQISRPIPDRPRLRYIEKTLVLLDAEDGINWKNLHEKIASWESGLDLSFKIGDVVREYVAFKIPGLKKQIPPIADFPEEELLDALTNGWFEELEGVHEKRKEILLSAAANVVQKIEARIYKLIIGNADERDLAKLGLNANTKQLALDVLDSSIKVTSLFIRFLAYSALSKKPPAGANKVAPVGVDGKPHTYNELFPHETQYITKKLSDIVSKSALWENEEGAEDFKKYIEALAIFFAETNPEKALLAQEKLEDAYGILMMSEFPISIVPPLEGFYKPPYLDPELRVVLRTPDSKSTEKHFYPIKESMAEHLGDLGVGQFSDEFRNTLVRSYISIGNYGAGLTFNAVAQEDKGAVIYLNEHQKAFNIPEFRRILEYFDLPADVFESVSDERLDEMFQENTMMHELSHGVYNLKTQESVRLGAAASRQVAEISAEAIFRGIAKEMLRDGSLKYSDAQYAAVDLGISLSVLEDSEPDDEYYKASVYALNALFEQNIVEFDGVKIRIVDFNKLFDCFRKNADKIISVYRDEKMTEKKAAKWINENTIAGPKLQKLIEYIKANKNK